MMTIVIGVLIANFITVIFLGVAAFLSRDERDVHYGYELGSGWPADPPGRD